VIVSQFSLSVLTFVNFLFVVVVAAYVADAAAVATYILVCYCCRSLIADVVVVVAVLFPCC